MERMGAMSTRISSLKIEKVEEQGIYDFDKSVNSKSVNSKCFDLSGRKIDNRKSQHAIVIMNGKKVIK